MTLLYPSWTQSRRNVNQHIRDTTPVFTAVKLYSSQANQPGCPITQSDKENVVQMYNGVLLSHKEE
jgi:hypothetical protein